MSLFEKYACLYENTRFTAEEQAEIGEFVVGLMKCAAVDDKAGMARLFDKHFAYVDDETLSKIGRVCYYFSKYGEAKERSVINEFMVKEAEEKVAGIGSILSKLLGKGAPAPTQPSLLSRFGGGLARAAGNTRNIMETVALIGLAAPVVKASLDAMTEGSRLKSSLATILKNHPELRNDANVAQYFQMLTTFAPAAAANPLVAGNILMSLHETGPSFVTPQYIASLLQIQEKAVATAPMQNQINELARGVMTVAKDVGKSGGPQKMDVTIRQPDKKPFRLSGRVAR